jgi:hypothetical protein
LKEIDMTHDEARIAVRSTLTALTRIAQKTRTPADDMLLQILQGNVEKLSAAVLDLSAGAQPPTDERVSAALNAAGIKV